MSASPFRYIDLFAGIGGFRLALDKAGGRCVGYSDIDSDAITTYCANHGDSPADNLGDIRQIQALPPHELMTAGVPCQSWSIAGRNLGFDDDRGQLWNDTLALLHQAQPQAFIFENVKGLADPRNEAALAHILARIRQAGYAAAPHVLNSADFGVAQDRVRVYIIGFKNSRHFAQFRVPAPCRSGASLGEVLGLSPSDAKPSDVDLFGQPTADTRRYRTADGMNDFFLFNDIRNGPSTVHSWDLRPTTPRQHDLCLLLLRNRRKERYGKLDGNPMSLRQLQSLDASVQGAELEALVELGIFKRVPYGFAVSLPRGAVLDEAESLIAGAARRGEVSLDDLRGGAFIKLRARIDKAVANLEARGWLRCTEHRYEFRYTKISTGIEGINRIFLPRSQVFPTLVASDTNDYVALRDVQGRNAQALKQAFLREVYAPGLYRKITREEACLMQGFPQDFALPEARPRWMKLIGNSVSVPVVETLIQAIQATGCFGSQGAQAQEMAA